MGRFCTSSYFQRFRSACGWGGRSLLLERVWQEYRLHRQFFLTWMRGVGLSGPDQELTLPGRGLVDLQCVTSRLIWWTISMLVSWLLLFTFLKKSKNSKVLRVSQGHWVSSAAVWMEATDKEVPPWFALTIKTPTVTHHYQYHWRGYNKTENRLTTTLTISLLEVQTNSNLNSTLADTKVTRSKKWQISSVTVTQFHKRTAPGHM